LVPLGSPATIVLTVDPDANILAGVAGYPSDAGAYLYSAVIDFTGRQYTINGSLETNYDPIFSEDLDGQILDVIFSESGPPLLPGAGPGLDDEPGIISCFNFAHFCQFLFVDGAIFGSPALPVPFPIVAFPLYL